MGTLFKRLSILFLILLMLVGFFFLSRGYGLPHYSSPNVYTEPDWTLSADGQEDVHDFQFPLRWPSNKATNFTLSTTLTYRPTDQDLPCAFVSLNHMYCRIFLNGTEIYTYTEDSTPNRTQSPGNVHAVVPLGSSCTGKELRIEITPTLHCGLMYTLPPITFGDFTTVLRHTFLSDLPRLILAASVLFCGLVLAGLSLFFPAPRINKQLWYVGLFAILFAVYNASESLFVIYMVSNPYFLYLTNFIVFALLPIPLLHFYQERIGHQLSRVYFVVHILLIANVVIQVLFHFCDILDIRQMLPMTHVMYVCTLILISASLFWVQNKKQRRLLTIETLILTAGAVLNVITFYLGISLLASNSALLQAAVFLVMLIEGFDALHNLNLAYRNNLKSLFYKELAYTDALTKLKNRVAFNDEVDVLKSNSCCEQKLICMSVDVNGLKIVNDTLGHLAGDILIKTTADFLRKYFASSSSIFRTGGDEFILFIYNTDTKTLDLILQQMYDEIRLYNQTADITVSFALGYCEYDGRHLDRCLSSADSNMYRCKEKMQSQQYTCRSTPQKHDA